MIEPPIPVSDLLCKCGGEWSYIMDGNTIDYFECQDCADCKMIGHDGNEVLLSAIPTVAPDWDYYINEWLR